MSSAPNSHLVRRAILLGAPVVALIATLIHPRFYESTGLNNVLGPQVELWIGLHVAQLVIFGLLAVLIYWLIEGVSGAAATISRIALWIFIVFYPAFDALAGIATGLVIHYAKTLPPDQLPAVSNAIDAFFQNQMVNNIGVVGSIGWGVGVLAAAVALARPATRRVPVGPVALAIFIVTALSFALELDTGSVWWWAGAFLMALVFGLVARPQVSSALLVLASIFFAGSHVFPLGTVGMGALWLAVAYLVFFSQRTTAAEPVLSVTPVSS